MENSTKNLKSCKLFVDGMHCASCEILIEKKLLKSENIESVDASLKTGEVDIFFEGNKPDINKINEQFKSLGYKFSEKKFKKKKDSSFISFKNGILVINPDKIGSFFSNLFLVSGIILGFLLLERSGLASRFAVNEESQFPAYFVYGLLAGSTTCTALVGGVLLSMSKQWNEVYIDSDRAAHKSIPHILFHFGRLLSFAIVGGILALIGTAAESVLKESAIFITVLVSSIMLVMALSMLEVGFANRLIPHLPNPIGRFAGNEENFKGKFMPFLTGFFSFLIPCGLTLTAFIFSLKSGSFTDGALNMLSFALGTFVFLTGISIASIGFNLKPAMTAKFNKIAGVLLIFFALFTLNSQIIAVNAEYGRNFPTTKTVTEVIFPRKEIRTAQKDSNNSDTQVISLRVNSYSFSPSVFQVEVGKKVVWHIDGRDASGCTGRLIGKGLFEGQLDISGKNKIVEFTPTKKGTYNFSCWMGMVSGQIRVV